MLQFWTNLDFLGSCIHAPLMIKTKFSMWEQTQCIILQAIIQTIIHIDRCTLPTLGAKNCRKAAIWTKFVTCNHGGSYAHPLPTWVKFGMPEWPHVPLTIPCQNLSKWFILLYTLCMEKNSTTTILPLTLPITHPTDLPGPNLAQ